MQELFDNIQSAMAELSHEMQANMACNKAAGVRARKITLKLEQLFKQYRKESVEASKK